MRVVVRCISEGGLFQDGWGNLFVILGTYIKNECYIIQRNVVIKRLLSQKELMASTGDCEETHTSQEYH